MRWIFVNCCAKLWKCLVYCNSSDGIFKWHYMMKMMIDDIMWNPASWMDCKIKHHETPHICEHFIFQWVDTLKTDDWWKWPLCFKNWNLMKNCINLLNMILILYDLLLSVKHKKSLCLADCSAYTKDLTNVNKRLYHTRYVQYIWYFNHILWFRFACHLCSTEERKSYRFDLNNGE